MSLMASFRFRSGIASWAKSAWNDLFCIQNGLMHQYDISDQINIELCPTPLANAQPYKTRIIMKARIITAPLPTTYVHAQHFGLAPKSSPQGTSNGTCTPILSSSLMMSLIIIIRSSFMTSFGLGTRESDVIKDKSG